MDFSGLLDRGCSGAQVLFAGCPDISGTGELSLSLVSACLSVLSLMTSTSGALQSQAARVFGAAWASQDFGAFLDSGSNVGLLSFDAAMKLLRDRRLSMLRVIGISGKTFPADVSGQLVWELPDAHGCRHRVGFSTAHGMRGCPMNFLSVSLLVEIGGNPSI